MGYQQQNRFCGIIRKKVEVQAKSFHPKLENVWQVNELVTYFTQKPISDSILFDGAIDISDLKSITMASFNQLSGNWACAVRENQKLILGRDKIGIRAIYYFENDDYFCFSNEIKMLLELDFVPFKVSNSAAFKFLFFNENDVLGDSLFEGITELPPGHFLDYDLKDNSYSISKYHEIQGESGLLTDVEETSQHIRKQISTATADIVQQSSKGASLLSGGIDSSAIAASLYLNGDHLKLPFCTAITDDVLYDEVDFAGEVVKHFGIQNWNQIVATSVDKELETMHFAMELPTYSLGSYLQYELMRFAQFQNIEYVLDGTGADALFAGHNYYKAVYWNSLIKSRNFSKLKKEVKYFRSAGFWLKYYIKNLLKYQVAPNFRANLKFQSEVRNNPLLSNLAQSFVQNNEDQLNEKRGRSMKDLNDFLNDDFYHGGVTRLLRFLDRFGKHFGVVNRSIFAENSSLYEYALRIDPKLKIQNDQLKYILRYAFKDYLPVKILDRNDKKGLVAPNNKWLKAHKALFMSYLDQDLSEYFDMDNLRRGVSESIDKLSDIEDYKLFKFISFAIWYKVFNEKYGS